jgi:AraC-like DNA-binding protein
LRWAAVSAGGVEPSIDAPNALVKDGVRRWRGGRAAIDRSLPTTFSEMDTPCYSGRFIEPFARLLESYEGYPAKSLQKLKTINPDARIPMEVAHRLAVEQVEQTGDPDLGLKAARLMPFGRSGPLAYAIQSAANVRDAITVAARFGRLFCDGSSIHFDVRGRQSVVRFASMIPLPRPVADFALSCWYLRHVHGPAGQGKGLECWFSSAKPQGTDEYERTFSDSSLRFGAPFDGFVFSSDCLDAPLLSADRRLYQMLCEHLALTADHLVRRRTLAGAVRQIVLRELLHTAPSIISVAQQLRMSVRTLGRGLEREGTTYSAVLDDVRRELALRYVGNSDIALRDASFRLGFSHPEAFSRAFRRWTGLTPTAYRRWKAQ